MADWVFVAIAESDLLELAQHARLNLPDKVRSCPSAFAQSQNWLTLPLA